MIYGYHSGLGFFGGIFSLIFWGLFIWLIISLFRGRNNVMGNCGHLCEHDKSTDPAMDILRERYAKGEIFKEEFEERKQVLRNS